ncbi:peptidoglycan DD-metalloendopeptidase family protein [Pseudoalteromonas luteoviolacea]|uniref:M23 family metallopeptidase n=1 Tax=Pseudoalteromonas luteoviolacea TaxID=43657 RepID=UPI001F4816AC|nr:peptidoglycan DD-metalloendopeptidase family protein [Pseudoalteromonas luteoviolacea]MCF6441593.1 peptidoglycan DD-metalloendopeptidase family protein [Pseudoalteromonas luteoviolacea]
MIKNSILITAALVVGGACTSENVDKVEYKQTPGDHTPIEETTSKITEASIKTEGAPSQIVRVDAGENLLGVLKRFNVTTSQVISLISAVKPWLDLNKLATGQVIQVTLNENDDFKAISIGVKFATIITATLAEQGWQVTESQLETEFVDRHIQVNIGRSLYNSALDTGMDAEVIQRAIAVLSYQVDFQRSLQETDVFEVIYQSTQLINPHVLSSESDLSKVRYIKLTVSGQVHALYLFEESDDKYERFYYADGRPVQSFLLKTPLNGARLSSTFGHRKHPILGFTRLHKGLDFAATVGTSVFAAGDGKILKANWGGSFGNRVTIKHANGYKTLYAHLRSFAKGLKAGQFVKQGQVIGYLGNTGLSQAPHLHYEVHKDGHAINPLKLNMPQLAEQTLSGMELAAFLNTVSRIEGQLQQRHKLQNESSELVFNYILKENLQ